MHEHCVCAAIHAGVVIRGKRHHDCFKHAKACGYSHIGAVQGFVTSKGRFVDRREGLRLQQAAGIASANPDGYRDQLYSDDLY